MIERLTEEHIAMDLETLSHGGGEAIALFLEMSKRLHEDDADFGLHDWVTVAAPALPEKERNEVLVLLLSCVLRSSFQQISGRDRDFVTPDA
jgi:hypothetical protein